MAVKLLFLILLIGGLFWAYQVGILDSLSSNNTPKVGKEVKLCSSIKGAEIPVAADLPTISRAIDSHLGSESDKLAGAMQLAGLYHNGDLVKLAENTKARVAGVNTVKVHSMPFQVVKIKILSGSNKGGIGWVERDNVIDTPMHELLQSFRTSSSGAGKRRDVGGALVPLATDE